MKHPSIEAVRHSSSSYYLEDTKLSIVCLFDWHQLKAPLMALYERVKSKGLIRLKVDDMLNDPKLKVHILHCYRPPSPCCLTLTI
jgi:hypothetical protein